MIEECKICGSKKIKEEYSGIIRDGGIGKYTKSPVTMFKCEDCNTIWHEPILDTHNYYESDEYRLSLEDSVEEADFYKIHDKESIDKLSYTGMFLEIRWLQILDADAGHFWIWYLV